MRNFEMKPVVNCISKIGENMKEWSAKKCGCNEHYWLKNNWQWQFKSCNFRTTLRSGTISNQ